MIQSLIALLLSGMAFVPRHIVGWWRRRRLGRNGVVRVQLGASSERSALARTVSQVAALRDLAEDPAVRAVMVELGAGTGGGWASVQELRRALEGIQATGKLVVLHLDSLTNRELYLASAADRIWLTPSAEVMLSGLGAQMTFFGDAFSRFGIQLEVETAGAFKSFGESWSRGYASAPNRTQVGLLIGDLQDQMVASIAAGRRVAPQAVLDLMDRSPAPPEAAVAAGLVDGLAYPDQAMDALGELLDHKVRPVPFEQYRKLAALERWLSRLGSRADLVAVVHLEGPVVPGGAPGGRGSSGIDAERVVPVLDELRDQPRVKAVVLYVNSPGGSALASDLIARSVQRLRDKKPVVALFGDVSASGGYYLAAPAAEIVAREGTITGSIGVIGMKPVIADLAGRVGVHHEVVDTGIDPGLFTLWAPFSPDQRQRFRSMLDRTYERFLAVVSAGRKMPRDAVHAVAEGRVWTGKQALDLGLVDHLGGLDVALHRARSLAGLPEQRGGERHIRPRPPLLRMILARLNGAATHSELGALLGRWGGPLGTALMGQRVGQALALLPWQLHGDADPR